MNITFQHALESAVATFNSLHTENNMTFNMKKIIRLKTENRILSQKINNIRKKIVLNRGDDMKLFKLIDELECLSINKGRNMARLQRIRTINQQNNKKKEFLRWW